jgi:hypothetical protein
VLLGCPTPGWRDDFFRIVQESCPYWRYQSRLAISLHRKRTPVENCGMLVITLCQFLAAFDLGFGITKSIGEQQSPPQAQVDRKRGCIQPAGGHQIVDRFLTLLQRQVGNRPV